jgi:hypothetical protein
MMGTGTVWARSRSVSAPRQSLSGRHEGAVPPDADLSSPARRPLAQPGTYPRARSRVTGCWRPATSPLQKLCQERSVAHRGGDLLPRAALSSRRTSWLAPHCAPTRHSSERACMRQVWSLFCCAMRTASSSACSQSLRVRVARDTHKRTLTASSGLPKRWWSSPWFRMPYCVRDCAQRLHQQQRMRFYMRALRTLPW